MPTSSTPAMTLNNPGSPKPGPSPLGAAAACVGLADLVSGLFQFESVDGPVDGVAPGVLVTAWADGVSCTAVSLGSGAIVETGAGAGSAGCGGGGGAWVGAGGCTVAEGCCPVGVGRGLRGSDGPGKQIKPQVGEGSDVSASAGATADRPTESARTATAAVADMTRSTEGCLVMDTFSTARGPQPRRTNDFGSLLQVFQPVC
ncbi:hypothetical protein QFZ30_002777 [Arthrobacter pascens]|nr:hypothetical protein [Arthrobacter pascens]